MLVVGLLASCSGVKQADLDAANAAKAAAEAQVTTLQGQLSAANAAKTKAETDLAAAHATIADVQAQLTTAKGDKTSLQNQLSSAQTSLADANKALDAAKATIAAYVASGAILPPTLSFAASSYTDSTYKFTFSYNKTWTATWKGANNPVSFGDATYYDPSVRVFVVPSTLGATLADVLKTTDIEKLINAAAPPGTPVIGEVKDNVKNAYGTTVTSVVHQYTTTTATKSTAYCKSFGFIKDGNWIILFLTQDSGWGVSNVNGIYPDEVFATWKFN